MKFSNVQYLLLVLVIAITTMAPVNTFAQGKAKGGNKEANEKKTNKVARFGYNPRPTRQNQKH
jgi:hypothetical protein